jgi:acyl-CoA dehydrogenase
MAYWLLFFVLTLGLLAWYRASLRTTAATLGAAILFYGLFGESWILFILMALAGIVVFVPLVLAPLRQEWISRPALAWFRRVLARLDATLPGTLDAGTAWWEAELFGGSPDWARFASFPPASAPAAEQSSIDGIVAEYSRLHRADPAAAAAFVRENGLGGLGIEGIYGGLELSAVAQSQLLMRVAASAGVDAALALGSHGRLTWIALLQHQATDAQRSDWLPRLAAGETLAVFDDALVGSIERVEISGEVRLRLTLDPAITAQLGSASLVGLRIERIARGGGPRAEEACLLIERSRLAADVAVIDESSVIAQGRAAWSEARAIAKAVALPALQAASTTAAALAAGSYLRVRAPFGDSLEALATAQEAVAELGSEAYAAQAIAALTALAVDLGEKPRGLAVFAHTLAVTRRRSAAAAIDDLGLDPQLLAATSPPEADGASPRLVRAQDYTMAVLRSHAAFLQALSAARSDNPARALEAFDQALWSHVGHGFASATRALLLGLTAGGLANAGPGSWKDQRYRRRINRYAAALSFTADAALNQLGLTLASSQSYTALRAAREASRLTATMWLGDALAQLVLASAAIKQYEDGGRSPAETAVIGAICSDAFTEVEAALERVIRQLPSALQRGLAQFIAFPLGRGRTTPREDSQRLIAQQLKNEGPLRRRLAAQAGLPTDATAWPELATALAAERDAAAIERRVLEATAAEVIDVPGRILRAQAAGTIDGSEAQQLRDWREAVRRLRPPAIPH